MLVGYHIVGADVTFETAAEAEVAGKIIGVYVGNGVLRASVLVVKTGRVFNIRIDDLTFSTVP